MQLLLPLPQPVPLPQPLPPPQPALLPQPAPLPQPLPLPRPHRQSGCPHRWAEEDSDDWGAEWTAALEPDEDLLPKDSPWTGMDADRKSVV